ncbi:MAG: DNA-3-methyladenine glycosylase [candidate division Zixibacteria bacterium]|nr:DNA-3-methyladenine glycosylase [candidate division Zixibacteria bacterium]
MTEMILPGRKLTRGFYLRPTLEVAPDLLRKTLVFHHPGGILAADIVETEAYIGEEDPACHAAVGRTARNDIMYAVGGHCYIYFIYGMYYCLNVVTERKGFPAAVLIRAAEPVAGQDIIAANSPGKSAYHTNGPGKLCRAFDLTRKENGLDLTGPQLYIIDRKNDAPRIGVSARIGVRHGGDKQWRFFDRDSPHVSR